MITLELIQNRLSEGIRRCGQTQQVIAEAIGVKQPTIRQYLTGRSMPALDTFAKLCLYLDVDPAYILGMYD